MGAPASRLAAEEASGLTMSAALHYLLEAVFTVGLFGGVTGLFYLIGEVLKNAWSDIHPKN